MLPCVETFAGFALFVFNAVDLVGGLALGSYGLFLGPQARFFLLKTLCAAKMTS